MLKRLHFYDELPSTNTTAYELALAGAPEGEVVMAEAQSRGRGRLERSWHSPPGKNLYVSLILRPSLPITTAPQLTLVAGIAVAEVIARHCPGRVQIKWPNDVQVGGRKISGILTEAKASAEGVEFIIVGIGINVNMEIHDFPKELQETATSFLIEAKKNFCRLHLLNELFLAWDKWYETFLRQGFEGIRDAFLAFSPMEGKRVRVTFRQEVWEGVVVEIDEQGALLVRDERGQIHRIMAGDIELVKN
ncbi:MAG TPA: biotin--[acetyl-CoA-carboxylase] ligase [Syntrophales bacterium]|nr:biotin--[acetyl-CoA-carboxylase] ligase [Syntrophales bacterium]HOL58671.1 biotin--[acetyl-CoA-carboxylase] ligase [Syntrophales bacterium]HPO35041.1 biotin--[acetyl-CoA-carboxylase] ligase [Syntrophales bacterium]